MKTAGDVIREALRKATITGASMPVEASDFAEGWSSLNNVLMALQAEQIHLWSETEAILPLNPGQVSYTFPGDHCFTDYVLTSVVGNYLANDTSFTLASVIGIAVDDHIGIELADGTRWWTTVNFVAGQLGTMDVAPSEISDGASVYVYRTAIEIPVRILSARYSDRPDWDEIQTNKLSRDTYYNMPSKNDRGAVNSWYFSRQIGSSILNVWPTAQSCRNVLRFTFIRPQTIPQDQSNRVEVPEEWFLALVYKVAAELGLTYSIDAQKQAMLEAKAEALIATAKGSDNEFSTMTYYPG